METNGRARERQKVSQIYIYLLFFQHLFDFSVCVLLLTAGTYLLPCQKLNKRVLYVFWHLTCPEVHGHQSAMTLGDLYKLSEKRNFKIINYKYFKQQN